MPKLIAYTRVSTDAQADSGLGLAAQISSITTHLCVPDEIYSDEGISGSRADRPELLKAIEALKAGDTLAVAKMDRLARGLMLTLFIEKEVAKKGAVIVSAAGEGTGGDNDSPSDKLMRNIFASIAEYERQIIGQRTKAALAVKKQRGERVSRFPPYGYRFVGDITTYDRLEHTIYHMAKQLHKEHYSYSKIAGHLEEFQWPARSGKWTKDKVRRLLQANLEDDHSPVPSCK